MHKNKAYKTIGINSADMHPSIGRGDRLCYRRIDKKTRLKVGDVLVYLGAPNKKTISVGRLLYVSTNTNRFILKSDSMREHNIVSKTQLVGRAFAIRRRNVTQPINAYTQTLNSLYWMEMLKISRALEKKGLKFVFLRGLPLWLAYLDRQPNKPYVDCDLYIQQEPSDYEAVLQKNGYSCKDVLVGKRTAQTTYTKCIGQARVHIDIHRFVFSPTISSFYVEQFFSRDKMRALGSHLISSSLRCRNGFRVCTIHEMIVTLLLHFQHHNWTGIQRLSLLEQVLNRYSKKISPKKLAYIINKYDLHNYCAGSLMCTARLYPKHSDICHNTLKQLRAGRYVYYYMSLFLRFGYNEQPRIFEGVLRFFHALVLSPRPIRIRLSVFFMLGFWRGLFASFKKTRV